MGKTVYEREIASRAVVVAKAIFSVSSTSGLCLVPSVLSSSTESTLETSLLEAVFSQPTRIIKK